MQCCSTSHMQEFHVRISARSAAFSNVLVPDVPCSGNVGLNVPGIPPGPSGLFPNVTHCPNLGSVWQSRMSTVSRAHRPDQVPPAARPQITHFHSSSRPQRPTTDDKRSLLGKRTARKAGHFWKRFDTILLSAFQHCPELFLRLVTQLCPGTHA